MRIIPVFATKYHAEKLSCKKATVFSYVREKSPSFEYSSNSEKYYVQKMSNYRMGCLIFLIKLWHLHEIYDIITLHSQRILKIASFEV